MMMELQGSAIVPVVKRSRPRAAVVTEEDDLVVANGLMDFKEGFPEGYVSICILSIVKEKICLGCAVWIARDNLLQPHMKAWQSLGHLSKRHATA